MFLRLNFFKTHVISFTLAPIIGAAIMTASNGQFPVAYIDALFVCVSAVTGTGLATIELSALTAWQQTIIVILELLGSQATVAWLVVLVRRRYFTSYLDHIVQGELKRQRREDGPSLLERGRMRTMQLFYRGKRWRSRPAPPQDAPSPVSAVSLDEIGSGFGLELRQTETPHRVTSSPEPMNEDLGEWSGAHPHWSTDAALRQRQGTRRRV
ncbi:hypothetical protein K488DRAFT_91561 [Vararia minispora EC-137]|uniref:Uncharacterized protein n=1 Tax=Vararia minispora EC-137 TaxID=1314806 RepID=A0ACB8Q5B0_9AGAM|nr:hypothetical protein K488DRAFT_91561 [Vararia minispora EC-137]